MKDFIPTLGEIASVAHRLWSQAGKPAGRDLEFWMKAESRVVGRYLSDVAILAAEESNRSDRSFAKSTSSIRRKPHVGTVMGFHGSHLASR